MNRKGNSGRKVFARLAAAAACAVMLVGAAMLWSGARMRSGIAQAATRTQMRQPPAKAFPLTLTIASGTNASYRVREQLVGVNFPSDAVGTSTAVTGAIVFNKDGSIDGSRSKLTFDLRTLKSDQPMRDGFIQSRTLETDRYPAAVFVPKTITGMPNPLAGQFGFELSGDMTIHGQTVPLTWQGIATVDPRSGLVAGRATTNFKFETFGMQPPKIFRVMSVNDNIELAVEFRFQIG